MLQVTEIIEITRNILDLAQETSGVILIFLGFIDLIFDPFKIPAIIFFFFGIWLL